MAIPITYYISIQNRVVSKNIGDRDFSGLLFTNKTMATNAPQSIKADFDGDKVVSLSLDEVKKCFSDAGLLAFASSYFGYSGGTKRPPVLNFAKVGASETPLAAYNRVTADFANFGTFAFYGTGFELGSKGGGDMLDVALANEGNEYGWVFVVETDTDGQAAASAALGDTLMLTHLTHSICEPMSWYAAVDYAKAGSAGTIDYKRFPGSTATVTDGSAKITADGLRVNYVGLAQTYGTGVKFYQTGVNLDGTDLGVVRDMCWLNSEVTRGYFDLQANIQKMPANYVGVTMVKNLVAGVATRAVANGVILLEKPLTSAQVSTINEYAADDGAADVVQTSGYYISADINDKNECSYTLIYAKGDHIVKVNGLNVIV